MNGTFGERLSVLIKKRGIKKKELAEEMYVTPQTVSRWCQGHIIPDKPTLQLLADFFRVSPEYLLGDTDFSNQTNHDPKYLASLDRQVEKSNSLNSYLESLGYVVSFHTEKGNGFVKARDNKFCRELVLNQTVTVTIQHGEKTNLISSDQWDSFVEEMENYMEFRLNKLL